MPSTEDAFSSLTKDLAEVVETLTKAVRELNRAIDAMWNDQSCIAASKLIADRHGSAICQAQEHCDEALAAYAASPAESAGVSALNAWNWLAKNPNVELCYVARLGVWGCHRINPEWKLIGAGATPLEAVLAAMAAAGGE